MKAVSASIVVLAGAILIASGVHVHHNDTQVFVCGLGCMVGLTGLLGWFVGLKDLAK